MREKYIEEKYPRYFIFGTHKDGLVDVADTNNDTLVTVTRRQALDIISERDKIVDRLVEVCQAMDEVDHKGFSKIWYE